MALQTRGMAVSDVDPYSRTKEVRTSGGGGDPTVTG
jgi:hypothetical protein